MSLKDGFSLSEASHKELDEVMQVMEAAFTGDKIWKGIFKNADKKIVHAWIVAHLLPRSAIPDIITYKITENSSGKIVAWTALQFPWKYKPEMTEKLKTAVQDHTPAPLKENMARVAMDEFMDWLGMAGDHGYDPEKDYHLKATMVHPDYQKSGFGNVLTQYCNAIATKSGDRTWVLAREKSIKMFRNNGFRNMAEVGCRVERWGGDERFNLRGILVREP